jgi:DNA-binding NtrC family response regulator
VKAMEMMVKQESGELTLEQAIKGHLEWILHISRGNRSQAARILGLPLSTLRSKMKMLGAKAATQGGQVGQPPGKDSPPKRGGKSTVGHLV